MRAVNLEDAIVAILSGCWITLVLVVYQLGRVRSGLRSASRPLPSVADSTGPKAQVLSEVQLHVPSSLLPWERMVDDEE